MGERVADYDYFSVDLVGDEVVVSGEIDAGSCSQLLRVLTTLRRPEAEPLRVDLSGVTFVDSRGVQALVRLNRTVPMEITAVSVTVDRVLHMTGLSLLSVTREPEPAT